LNNLCEKPTFIFSDLFLFLDGFLGGGLLFCCGLEFCVLLFFELLFGFLFCSRLPLDLRGVEKPFAEKVDWVFWFLLVHYSHTLGNDQADSLGFQVFRVRLEALLSSMSGLLRHLNFRLL